MNSLHEVVWETSTVVNDVLVCTVVEVKTMVEAASVVSNVVDMRLVETTVTGTTTLLVAVTVHVGTTILVAVTVKVVVDCVVIVLLKTPLQRHAEEYLDVPEQAEA
jgi:hypothetical protein